MLLLGARGAVGRHIRELLTAAGIPVRTAGRSGEVDLRLDLDDAGPASRAAYVAATAACSAVVNATGREHVRLAELSEAPFVEIGASSEYLRSLAASSPAGRVVHSVGLVPGLSTLMLASLAERMAARSGPDARDEADVALLRGVGERHGDAAVAWTAGLLGSRFDSPADGGRRVLNLTEPRRIRLPGFGTRTVVRADFSDQLVSADGRLAVRCYLAVSSRAATAALRAATHVPALRPLASAHLPGTERWALTVSGRSSGLTVTAHGVQQSRATAEVTALAVQKVVERGPEVLRGRIVALPDLIDLDDVRASTSLGITEHG